MKRHVTIVDYGIGNIFSVRRALEHVGAYVAQASSPDEIRNAERVVLPGVGAFAGCMQGLQERGLIDPLIEIARNGRPLLGICVGMQMLATSSEEFGNHAGLDLIPGRVVSLPGQDLSGKRLKIPHVGWSALRRPQNISWADSPFANIGEEESVYVVHSYAMKTTHNEHRVAEFEYGGHIFTAAVRRENIFGCQFHPEKSGSVGLGMLAHFVNA